MLNTTFFLLLGENWNTQLVIFPLDRFFPPARAFNFTLSQESTPIVPANSSEIVLNTTAPVFEGSQNETKANITHKMSCLVMTHPPDYTPMVEVSFLVDAKNPACSFIFQIVNSTQLLTLMNVQANVTSPQTPATCLLVFFYSPSCPFSCKAAPYFNAFARVYTGIKMAAVDTSSRHNFNAQYGIVGVPSLLLFHNGRPAARFNTSSDYNILSLFDFVVTQTGKSSPK